MLTHRTNFPLINLLLMIFSIKIKSECRWIMTIKSFILTEIGIQLLRHLVIPTVLENPVYKKRDKDNPVWKMKKGGQDKIL